ncbi:hypothetical protein [Pseudomonas sp. GZD-222]
MDSPLWRKVLYANEPYRVFGDAFACGDGFAESGMLYARLACTLYLNG